MSLADRFWSKVSRGGHDECWLWVAGTNGRGYGRFRAAGRSVSAHRYSWELMHGLIPRSPGHHGTCVCHRCDNTLCVNPAHLFLGTQTDNVRDRHEKSRSVRGERVARARLTAQQVRDIRANFALCRVTMADLARRFGVTHGAIHHIVNGKVWRHV